MTPWMPAIRSATSAAFPTSVWMRMYAWTTSCPPDLSAPAPRAIASSRNSTDSPGVRDLSSSIRSVATLPRNGGEKVAVGRPTHDARNELEAGGRNAGENVAATVAELGEFGLIDQLRARLPAGRGV